MGRDEIRDICEAIEKFVPGLHPGMRMSEALQIINKKLIEYDKVLKLAKNISAHSESCGWTQDCGCPNKQLHLEILALEDK